MSATQTATAVKSGCKINCFGMLLLLFLLWAIWFGVATPWGTFNIDIIPPRIWQP